ncbi:hypothetical protein BdWA1_000393 [Babesia duncani]|uniref:Uncharacterized protein n=1 Tax=Babesia duncani TaxID=323732 RepID=A0AAD9UPS8_9APIC|nr:hypothetical protein BdWA1_000393 [Babesia duncani]
MLLDCTIFTRQQFQAFAKCWYRQWAKKKHLKSTHYLLNDPESSLYRHTVPGDVLANRKRLPNVKLKPREFRLAPTSNGLCRLVAPYPPNVNITLSPYPRNVAGIQNDRHKMGHFKFTLQYKGIEYKVLKRLVPYPRRRQAFALDIDRIKSQGNKLIK